MKSNLPQSYRQLQNAFGKIGYFCRGSLYKRYMSCGKPGCACHASPPRLHGPYYQWTRKVAGKTVMVLLSAEQAELLSTWIENRREIQRIIDRMETLSSRVTDRMLNELAPPERNKRHAHTRRKRAPHNE